MGAMSRISDDDHSAWPPVARSRNSISRASLPAISPPWMAPCSQTRRRPASRTEAGRASAASPTTARGSGRPSTVDPKVVAWMRADRLAANVTNCTTSPWPVVCSQPVRSARVGGRAPASRSPGAHPASRAAASRRSHPGAGARPPRSTWTGRASRDSPQRRLERAITGTPQFVRRLRRCPPRRSGTGRTPSCTGAGRTPWLQMALTGTPQSVRRLRRRPPGWSRGPR